MMADGEKPKNEPQKAVTQDSKQEGTQELQRRIQEYLHALKEYERDLESKAAIRSRSGRLQNPPEKPQLNRLPGPGCAG
jgi:hypothetical protein